MISSAAVLLIALALALYLRRERRFAPPLPSLDSQVPVFTMLPSGAIQRKRSTP